MARLVTLRSRPGTLTGTIDDEVAGNTTALVIQLLAAQPGLRPASIAAHLFAASPGAANAGSARVVVAQLSRPLALADGQGLFNWLGPGSTAIGNLADQAASFGIPCEDLLFAGVPCHSQDPAGAAGTQQFISTPAHYSWRRSEAPIVPPDKWLAAILVILSFGGVGEQIQGMLTFNAHRTDAAGRDLLEQRP